MKSSVSGLLSEGREYMTFNQLLYKNSADYTAIYNIREIAGIQAVETVQCEFKIYDVSVGKGNALINLSKKLGFLQKEVVAIGDDNNDLDMMEKQDFLLQWRMFLSR